MTSQSVAPPGLSTAAVKRVTADSPLESNTLEQVIICIRHYICTLEFVYKLRIALNSKKYFKFYSAACNIAPFWGAPLLEREKGAFCIFLSVQNIWMPFWVHKTMPQMTPDLIPNFSLNPGKLTGESSHLSEVFGAFPVSVSKKQFDCTLLLFFFSSGKAWSSQVSGFWFIWANWCSLSFHCCNWRH